MEQPRREEFILDARRAARTSQKSNAHADSDTGHSDAIANILRRPGVWLSPKVVEHYHPDDFLSWQKEQQDRLRSAVEAFREIASQARPDQPLTIEQFTEGGQRFRELINVLGGMVLDEWLQAIGTVEKQVEEWSAEAEWRSRRVNKTLSESLIGTYAAPQSTADLRGTKSLRSGSCRPLYPRWAGIFRFRDPAFVRHHFLVSRCFRNLVRAFGYKQWGLEREACRVESRCISPMHRAAKGLGMIKRQQRIEWIAAVAKEYLAAKSANASKASG